ncbi:MAG: NAD(P)-binding protein [Zoogloea sp.]|uniref:NAD(P)-binding protein n=1 Tax=Zoogloea sp. TaxID=49181 RepID=UPI002624C543|nr:NAD(P)/FAD-dependent oxidoreductase [Zoogloea sp.]MDD3328166.1 NAD(P)-binding protein [Zoogloea sp.]
MISRRRFLTTAAAAGLAALPGCRRLEHLGLPITVLRPGMEAGHALRAGAPRPTPQREIRTGVAILGSGIAGLSAAWRLAKEGHDDFLLVEGPEPFGNAAAGRFDSPSGLLAFPRGAHYLPLPSRESTPVRELLHELRVIEADPFGPRPRFSEDALVHAPDERLYFAGAWRDGLLPTTHVGTEEAAQHRRFLAETARLTQAKGADGRRAFCVPLALSSADPAFRRLDSTTFRAWLAAEGYTSPSLHAYLDYVCRDEYGATPDKVSAWAGLHYFASRGGQAANAADGSLLTWPDGLAFLARGLAARVAPARQLAGHALAVGEDKQGVNILCATADGPVHIRARRAICAMPLHVAAHVVTNIRDYGFDPAAHLPPQAPWLVASLLLEGFPPEPTDAPLAWDNVIAGSRGLGWVVATHQLIRAARPAHTVFTAYRALADQSPQDARTWLATAPTEALFELAADELRSHYGPLELWHRTRAVEITLRGHGMAVPACGSLANPGLAALREADGRLLFAHSDLSGYSVFEEAAWWGDRAGRKVLG